MIQAAVAAFLLLGVYKLIEKKPVEGEFHIKVDWWLAFAFVLVPAILIFVVGIAVAAAAITPAFILPAYVLYFIVPFLVMKLWLDFKTSEALKLALCVPVVAIAIEILFAILLYGY